MSLTVITVTSTCHDINMPWHHMRRYTRCSFSLLFVAEQWGAYEQGYTSDWSWLYITKLFVAYSGNHVIVVLWSISAYTYLFMWQSYASHVKTLWHSIIIGICSVTARSYQEHNVAWQLVLCLSLPKWEIESLDLNLHFWLFNCQFPLTATNRNRVILCPHHAELSCPFRQGILIALCTCTLGCIGNHLSTKWQTLHV